MKKIAIVLFVLVAVNMAAFAGDVTITLNGVNPLYLNVKGDSQPEEAASISVYLYYCDDGVTTIASADNVDASQIETTWGWGSGLANKEIQTGSWERAGHTFTKRVFYNNADIFTQDDYWPTGGINAIVYNFSVVGTGNVFIELNGSDAIADYSAQAHTVTFANQDTPLPVELSSFQASEAENGVELKWSTESEITNLGFILERSKENDQWQTIASYRTVDALQGQGTVSHTSRYTFTDETIVYGSTYNYRLSDVNSNGESTVLQSLSITLESIPETTALDAPYPNPFNPETRIRYHLAETSPVEVSVFNVLGSKVATLVDGEQPAGSYNVLWNGRDDAGSQAASGMYLIVFKSYAGVKTHKVVLMR